mgnify:CR=1 FL=1
MPNVAAYGTVNCPVLRRSGPVTPRAGVEVGASAIASDALTTFGSAIGILPLSPPSGANGQHTTDGTTARHDGSSIIQTAIAAATEPAAGSQGSPQGDTQTAFATPPGGDASGQSGSAMTQFPSSIGPTAPPSSSEISFITSPSPTQAGPSSSPNGGPGPLTDDLPSTPVQENSPPPLPAVTTIVGTPGNDTLIGTNGPDFIQGLAGNDIVKAGAGDARAHEALFTQTVMRYLNSWNSFQPPYFFLIQTPGDFFPWSLFFPAAAVAWWRLRRDADATTGVDRVAWRASLVFLGIALVFFSLSPGKRGVYLLPAFPMLALCTARGFLSIGGRWRRIPLALLAFVGIVVGLVIPLVVALIRPRVALAWGERVGFSWVAALIACGASLTIGALFALRRHHSASRALASVVAGMAVCLSVLGTLGGAAWSRYQDGRGFGTVVATLVPREERLVMGRGKFELVLFYSNRRGTEVQNEEGLLDELRSGRARYVVLSREFYQQVRGRPEVAQLTLLADRWVGNTNLLLLGPPSGGKSTLAILLKRGLEEYSRTDAGAHNHTPYPPPPRTPKHADPSYPLLLIPDLS